MKDLRNIGILAHIDAGKTTVTEHLLYKSGTIRNLGSVDKGTAFTDSLEVEQQRGISVKASEANLVWKGININIIDTPGHADFVSEVERSLMVLDGAIVILSAVEGVQPQTEIYFKALRDMNIPTIFFINKVDRIGSNTQRVINEIKDKLTYNCLQLQSIYMEETQEPVINDLFNNNEKKLDEIIEICSDLDEEILKKYISEEEITNVFLKDKIKTLTRKGQLFPILFGAALRGIGINELMDSMIEMLPEPKGKDKGELSGVVYKVSHNKTLGKVSYVRLFEGEFKNRDIIYNHTKDASEKVTQIRKLCGQKEMDCGEIKAGEIAEVYGLSKASIGDILGNPEAVTKVPSLATPVLTLRVYPEKADQFNRLVEAFYELEAEDPLLHIDWIREKNELHIQIMGMIQLEILKSILLKRFNIEISFGKPSVIYKETPSAKGIGFEAYTMPKPCWAVVKFEIEPLKMGSGLVYESKIRTENVKMNYQREVEKQLPITLKQGLYGWEVTDLKVTLIEGEDHVMHSNPGDFLIATAIGIMNGLNNVGTTLLEPIIKFNITAPEEIGGKILGDLVQMRGTFDSPIISNGTFTVEGEMPAATSLEYPVRLGIISGGKAIISTKFSCYKPIPLEMGAIRERIGVNPLDRSKYILYSRNAIK